MSPGARDPNARENAGFALSWAEIGRLAEAITVARDELLTPALRINERFSLGPRGIWIIGLIAAGRIGTQADVAKLFRIGRSMVTEQIGLLIKQGLIVSEQSKEDQRKKAITLTELGWSVNHELGDAFTAKLRASIGQYSADDIKLCVDILCDIAGRQSAVPR